MANPIVIIHGWSDDFGSFRKLRDFLSTNLGVPAKILKLGDRISLDDDVGYADIAMALVLPREQGQAASLASYQLDVLRDKNRDLARRLHELVEIAHENEALMVRVHTLTLALMRARNLPETASAVVAALTEDFHTDLVRLVLFRADPQLPAAEWLIAEPAGAPAFPAFAEFLKRAEPLCGRLQQDKLVWMVSEITKAQLLAWRIGRLKDEGRATAVQISLAKRNNVWLAREAARRAREILGANGIADEFQAGRHFCNIEAVYTYEGTHDIHTLIVGEALTGLPAFT